MQFRALGRTGFNVSTISFGAWAIGGTWGDVDDGESLRALHRAIDRGVNFIDTADVYGDGRSERLVAQLRRERPRDTIIVATKAGRRLPQQTADGYSRNNLKAFIERSLKNLDCEAIDLLQLHCPPTDVYYRPEVFGVLDDLVKAGKIRFYGVSVERVEEALKAIEFPEVQSVQIIYNILRQRPADLFFKEALRKKVGVLARLPLSSGLLAGKLTAKTHKEAQMKILVVGASQGTGALAVKAALAQGHQVTAFARHPDKLDQHPGLTRATGDFHRFESVVKAMPGHDAVIITASSTTLKGFRDNPSYFSQGTANVIEAMKATAVKRLVVLSAMGVGDSRELANFLVDKLVISLFLKTPYVDHERQEKLVMESGLDWVIARPGRLTKGLPQNKPLTFGSKKIFLW